MISDLGLLITELQGSLRLSEKEVTELRALGGVLAGATGGRSVAVDLRFQDGDIYWSAFKIANPDCFEPLAFSRIPWPGVAGRNRAPRFPGRPR